jgi:DNA-binding NtrC family response regulator
MLAVSQSLIPDPIEHHITQVGELPHSPGILVLMDREDVELQAKYQAAGAEAVLYQDLPDDILREALSTAIALRTELVTKAVAARRAVARPQLSDFVSSSPAMDVFLRTVRQVVDSDVPLLILGETGVGKERLARAIHGESKRSAGPFISVNCGAVPEHLIESELFGHEEGAFTGATRARRGCFEMAHRGTIFLDEIAEMPLNLQVKLLHVLQDLEMRPVGGERTIPVDVRVMAATNRDILTEVTEKRFRRDLYYRLSVVTLELPPLRKRVDDIPTLTESFIQDLGKRVGRKVRRISREAMQALCAYSWPGNIRELINVIERAILLCEGHEITLEDLPEEISGAPVGQVSAVPFSEDSDAAVIEKWLNRPLKEVREAAVGQCERAYLVGLLRQTKGRIAETARRAGIEPRSLYDKMRRYGLRKEDFKHGGRGSPRS